MMDSSGETHPLLGSLLLPFPWLLPFPKTSQVVDLVPEADGALGHLTKAMSIEESDEEEEQRSNMATS